MRHPNTLESNSLVELTPRGFQQLQEPGTALSSEHLAALVMIDGRISVAQLEHTARMRGTALPRAVLEDLVTHRHLQICNDDMLGDIDPGSFFESASIVGPSLTASAASEHATEMHWESLQRRGYSTTLVRTARCVRMPKVLRGLTALAIEDDSDVCNLLRLYLSLEGVHLHTASTRGEIIDTLTSHHVPDLLLLDVSLPGLNGFDLLKQLRVRSRFQHLPIIMLTAETTRDAVLRGILGGADGYITKPFHVHPLVSAVKAVFGIDFKADHRAWDFSV